MTTAFEADPDYKFNQKLLFALHKIGTLEALEILERATADPRDSVGEAARDYLKFSRQA